MANYYSNKNLNSELIDIALDEANKTGDFSWVKRIARMLADPEGWTKDTYDPILAYEEFRRGYDVYAIDPKTGQVVYVFIAGKDRFLPDMSKAYDLDWYVGKDRGRNVKPVEPDADYHKIEKKVGDDK